MYCIVSYCSAPPWVCDVELDWEERSTGEDSRPQTSVRGQSGKIFFFCKFEAYSFSWHGQLIWQLERLRANDHGKDFSQFTDSKIATRSKVEEPGLDIFF